MPELDKDWYMRYFTAVRDSGQDLNAPVNGNLTLFSVAVAECNPGIVGALLELGVTAHPETRVIFIHDEDCWKVHNILVAAGFPKKDEEGSSDMKNDHEDESSNMKNGHEDDNHRPPLFSDLYDGIDIPEIDVPDNTSTASDYGNFDELFDFLNAPAPSSSLLLASTQNLYKFQVQIRVHVDHPEMGVIYTPF